MARIYTGPPNDGSIRPGPPPGPYDGWICLGILLSPVIIYYATYGLGYAIEAVLWWLP